MVNQTRLNKSCVELMLRKGLSVSEISDHFNYHTSNVYQFIKKNKIKLPKLNLVNKRWGHFTVIKELPSNGISRLWECKCDCGNLRILPTKSINREENKTCGCLLRGNVKSGSYNWNGHGEIHGKIWSGIKSGARIRGHNFGISIKYAWNLFLKQNRKCALSGVDIKFPCTVRDNENGGRTASLDRIDSNKGYIKGNVQWVHKNINLAKQELSDSDFIELCRSVVKHNKNNILK